MKTTGLMLVAFAIVFLGVTDLLKYKKSISLTGEILKLIKLFENEITYKKSSFSDLCNSGKGENYNYLSFENGKVTLPSWADNKISTCFNSFINKIGTTDEAGQISICHSFYKDFSEIYEKQKNKEAGKLQVNLSVSFLCAFSVVIIFI